MPNYTDSPYTSTEQDDPSPSTTAKITETKEIKINRIANEAAGRALKRQQLYERQHSIFTK